MRLIDKDKVLEAFDYLIKQAQERLDEAIADEDWDNAVRWEALKWELETLKKRREKIAYQRIVNLIGQIAIMLIDKDDGQFKEEQ